MLNIIELKAELLFAVRYNSVKILYQTNIVIFLNTLKLKTNIREGQKNTKVEFQLACNFIPSTRLSHFQKHKAHIWDHPGSASSRCHFSCKIYKGNSEKYKGKIRKQNI